MWPPHDRHRDPHRLDGALPRLRPPGAPLHLIEPTANPDGPNHALNDASAHSWRTGLPTCWPDRATDDFRHVGDGTECVDAPVRARERQHGVGVPRYGPPQLVHRTVVPTAERDQVVQVRQPTVGPVLNVVDVRELRVAAPREPTALVPPVDLHPLHHRRIPPDPPLIEDRPLPILHGEIHVGVAGQSPDDLGGTGRPRRSRPRLRSGSRRAIPAAHAPPPVAGPPSRRRPLRTGSSPLEQIQQRRRTGACRRARIRADRTRRRFARRLALCLRRHPSHQNRLRHCVVVLGERDPNRPSRVVEPQASGARTRGPPTHDPPSSPSTPPSSDQASARPAPASASPSACACASTRASTCARCHAANSRACRTLQCADASRNAASLDGEATSANGSTRSKRQGPRRQPLRQTRQRLEVRRRPHPLPSGRRADPALPGHPGDHGDGAVAPPSLGPIELGDVGQLSRCSAEICAVRSTILPANSCERASPPKFRHGGRRRIARPPRPPRVRCRLDSHTDRKVVLLSPEARFGNRRRLNGKEEAFREEPTDRNQPNGDLCDPLVGALRQGLLHILQRLEAVLRPEVFRERSVLQECRATGRSSGPLKALGWRR